MEFINFRSDEAIYQESLVLRNRILRLPLGRDVYAEDLLIEKENDFYGILIDEKLIATMSVYREAPFIAHLTAFAVDSSYQRKGYGRELLEFVLADLKKKGYKRINVDARAEAKVFYEKCGFGIIGKTVQNKLLGIDEYKMSYVF
ncbi:GNAT family N-acetyltransferase [Candidatus Enterococcus clewellii]|uniref:N-acetyltransferase domain-containing protein n=1 Tax=Candidatus Enterococcus clewellii TaxID=1834193 RepID=A0A242KBQ4_9ENTE|nr:GNAT family N-acetyltransferase [Enterococcus sp. 9E7_DIV0242]OTP18604.1 hypothetical protein A5888_000418 [Enterococcus sp. 9E7_DIV0242]